MRKILVIPLLILLMAVLFIGTKFTNQPKYSNEEIRTYNENLLKATRDNAQEDPQENPKPSVSTLTPPEIRPVYPQGLKDKQTVQAERVYLEFDSDQTIVSVTANGRAVPNLTDATITTGGTYEIVVTDNKGQKSTFTFTLIKD